MKDVAGAFALLRDRVEQSPVLQEVLDKLGGIDQLLNVGLDDVGDPRLLLPYSSDPVVKVERWKNTDLVEAA